MVEYQTDFARKTTLSLLANAKEAIAASQKASATNDMMTESIMAGRALGCYYAASSLLRGFPELQSEFQNNETVQEIVAFVNKWQG